MFRNLLILAVFFVFCFSTFESYIDFCFEEIELHSSDICGEESEKPEKEIEKDKIVNFQILSVSPFLHSEIRNENPSKGINAYLSIVCNISTPPPEI